MGAFAVKVGSEGEASVGKVTRGIRRGSEEYMLQRLNARDYVPDGGGGEVSKSGRRSVMSQTL